MKRTLAALLGASLLLVAPPLSGSASAQQVTVGDEEGDASGQALDLIGVTLSNDDRAVVATMSFPVTTNESTLVVSVDPRGGTGVRIVSRFKPGGTGRTENHVLARALTDRKPRAKRVPCRGVRHSEGWDASGNPTITLRMPSRCLAGGNYGALQFVVQTKAGRGRDWAPQQGTAAPIGWVPRG